MPLNPDQEFVIDSVSRRDIAELANGYMEYTGSYGDAETVASDDDRLTYEICCEYASALCDIDDDASADFRGEAQHAAIAHLIERIGIVETGPSESDDEIEQLKYQINLLSLRLQAKLTEKAKAAIDKVL